MVPIFIISYNRYTALKKLIDKLLSFNLTRIIILDNNSTYEPLLQYYSELKEIDIIRNKENFGHLILRELYKDKRFKTKYNLNKENFIYTDSDILPIDECLKDFVNIFNLILKKYPVEKVGFSLKIDDFPETFKMKNTLISWESQFWKNKIFDKNLNLNLYKAPIDTTFALRRAGTFPGWSESCYRTGFPYMARHLPWYVDSENLSSEDIFYINSCKDGESHFPDRYQKGKEI